MCSTMVGGGWQLAVGNWWLVAVGGGWRRLVVGDWWLVAVGSGWQLAVGRRWRLAAVGGWRLAVGGPLGRSLRAVLSKKKKSRPLRTALVQTPQHAPRYSPQNRLILLDAFRRMLFSADDEESASRTLTHATKGV